MRWGGQSKGRGRTDLEDEDELGLGVDHIPQSDDVGMLEFCASRTEVERVSVTGVGGDRSL